VLGVFKKNHGKNEFFKQLFQLLTEKKLGKEQQGYKQE